MGLPRQWPELVPDGNPHSFPSLVSAYFSWREVHGYSTRTFRTRRSVLARFVRWCQQGGLTRPAEVTKPILERYQRWLFYYRYGDGRVLSMATQYISLSTVKSFFSWLARYNHILSNPASDLEMPKTDQSLPRHVMSVAEVDLVMQQADLSTPAGIRDRALMEVLYSTGIRRMEVANLSIYDVDPIRGVVLIRHGKGKKDRVVPIGGRALGWIRKYLDEVRPKLSHDDTNLSMFLTLDGQRVNENSLSMLVAKYVSQAGINKTGSCHLFRHTMATLMLEGGADIRFIQTMLGHANVATTQIYTRVSIEKLKEVYKATHPGAEEKAFPLAAAFDLEEEDG